MPEVITREHNIYERSNFSVADRKILQRSNASSYIPAIQLPDGATLTVSANALEIKFFYSVSEDTKAETSDNGVIFYVGKTSRRLFGILGVLDAPNFVALRRVMNDIKEAVSERRKSDEISFLLQKHYALIRSLLEKKLFVKVNNEKSAIEAEVFNA